MLESKKHSVLVADDEKTYLMELTTILSPKYEVYAVKNGQDAISSAEELLPDVILLDIVMPDMDGYEVIYALKRSEKTADIPVIFVSGLSDASDEERGLHLGAADYISKPFSPAIVDLRVRNQVEIRENLRRIEHLSLTDQLTGLPNRRCFDGRLKIEWGIAQRERWPLSLLIVDIDFFKEYNDTFGHQQGDTALWSVASSIKKSIRRPSDLAARWGGEEFIILLPNTDSKGAVEVAEQIRRTIENMEIRCSDGVVTNVTVSIGVNTWTKDDNFSVDKFISGADRALYESKNGGRNRVTWFKGGGIVLL